MGLQGQQACYKLLISGATVVGTALGANSTTAPQMTEGRGFKGWTFWAYSTAGTFTVTFYGTIDRVNDVNTTWNYFQIGTVANAATSPLTYSGPLQGVAAVLTTVAGATVSAQAYAAP